MSIYLVIGIIVLIAMVAVAISAASQARELAVKDERSPDDQLGEFKRMFEAGEINEDEYQKMRKIIAEKMVKQVRANRGDWKANE